MPNQDGTGPNGNGPQTGRGCGPCNKPEDMARGTDRPRNNRGCGIARNGRNSINQKKRGLRCRRRSSDGTQY